MPIGIAERLGDRTLGGEAAGDCEQPRGRVVVGVGREWAEGDLRLLAGLISHVHRDDVRAVQTVLTLRPLGTPLALRACGACRSCWTLRSRRACRTCRTVGTRRTCRATLALSAVFALRTSRTD